MKEIKIIVLALGIGLILLLGVSLVLMNKSSEYQAEDPLPWVSSVAHNKVTILTITLGTSPLSQLMTVLGNEAEVALFKDKEQTTHSLEVYFSNAKIGGLQAQVIANLQPTKEILTLLNTQVKTYEVLPTGNEKVIFHHFAHSQLLSLPIKHLSIIPYTSIDIPSLKKIFGTPSKETKDYLLYSNRGLKILLSDKLIILEFSNDYLNI